MGLGYININPCGEQFDNGMATDPMLYIALYICSLSLVMGVYCFTITISLFDIFKQVFNTTSSFRKFMSSSAYGAYVLHPFILTPLTYSYACILNATGTATILFEKSSSTSCVGSDGWLWLGAVYTFVLTVLLVFPLAYTLKKVPGMSYVL